MARTFVIVGASLAGASAAIALRQAGADDRIVMIGAERELPYERPPLSKGYLRGDVPFEKALVRPETFYAQQRIELLLGVPATRLDADSRLVELNTGENVSFDALLIATGGRPRSLKVPGSDLEGTYTLRTREDTDRIRAEIRRGRRALVVGMGFIGSEVAASLRQEGVEVIVIEAAKAPLLRVLAEAVGSAITDLHRGHGVQIIFDDGVAAFEGTGRVGAAVTNRGLRIDCDFVVAGVGIDPADDLLSSTSARLDNGVRVDEFCESSVAGIYAAGDVANHFHPVLGRQSRVEHWQNALKQGAAAGRSMLGQRVPYDEIPWFWSDQYDANLQYAGFHTSWQELVIRGRLDSGNFLAFYVTDGRIDAVFGLNRAKEVRQSMPLIKSRRQVDLAKLQDDSTDLRSL